MGLHGDGIKQGIQDTFGEAVYQSADVLKDDYASKKVAVVEDANQTVYVLSYSKIYTSNLRELETKICHRIRRYLYDPVTKKRNKVTQISWGFDDGAPIIKQTIQNKRNVGKGYTKEETASMWIRGEIEKMFKNRESEIDFEKIRSTRCLFPFLVKYICKFVLERLQVNQILNPGDDLVTIKVIGAIQQVYLFVEPIKNCGSQHWKPLQDENFEGNLVFSTKRLTYVRTLGYNNSFTYSPRVEGEGEITLMSECRNLYEKEGFRDFYIVCNDTDCIPIFLLNWENMIPQSKVLIVLDEATSQFNPKERIMNVQTTVSLIEKYFDHHMPQIKTPVAFLCLWFALMGSDYVENIPGLTGTLFFQKFLPIELLQYLKTLDQGLVEKLIIKTPDGCFSINEDVTIALILTYHMNYPDSQKKNAEVQSRIKRKRPQTVEELHDYTVHLGKKKILSISTDDMYAHVRRAAWQLNYWLIGPTGFEKVWDPLLVCQREVNGIEQKLHILDANSMQYVVMNDQFVSLYGYGLGRDGNIIRPRAVYRQKKN